MDSKTILLSVLAVILVVAGLSASGLLSLFGSGMTITAISLANPPISGQPNEWIIDALVNGWGQSISGNLDATEIKYMGANALYPLSLTGSISSNQALYLIDNSNQKTIYKYSVTETHGSLMNYIIYIKVTPPAPCSGSPAYVIKGEAPSGWLGLDTSTVTNLCVYKGNYGVAASISALPNIYPTVKMQVTAKGQTQDVEMKSQGAYNLPNGLGSVNWVNSPVQGGSIGVLSIGTAYKPIAPYGTENWRVAYASDYAGAGVGQSWVDTSTELDGKLYSWATFSGLKAGDANCNSNDVSNNGVVQVSTCMKNYMTSMVTPANNLADKLLGSDIDINVAGSVRPTDYSYGRGFWVDLGNIYASAPQLQIRVKSDWIGINFPTGIPEVVSAVGEPYPFKSGEPLTAKITVKNVGSGTGNFIIQDITCGTLAPMAQISPASVPAGSTATISFVMGTSGKTSESGACFGKVVDTGSLKSATWSFNYKMDVPAVCEEGKKYWFGGAKIQICKNGILEDYTTCPYGVVADSTGSWVCANAPDNSTKLCEKTGEVIPLKDWTHEKCDKQPINGNLAVAFFVFVLSALIIAKNSIIEKEPVGITIGVLIAFALAYGVYWALNNLLTLAIFAALGGIALWLFGGFFIALALVIGSIVSGLRGK